MLIRCLFVLLAVSIGSVVSAGPAPFDLAGPVLGVKVRREGVTVTVPQGRQQVIVFLAPHTGGDLRTLIGAVRGRPGAFVRTSQDLNQAALDRSRLERFLAAVRVL